jgi:hypothetical protein
MATISGFSVSFTSTIFRRILGRETNRGAFFEGDWGMYMKGVKADEVCLK